MIAREALPTMGKDVTAKCYGGDATGKKKLRGFGKACIPQEALIKALTMDGWVRAIRDYSGVSR